MRHATILVLTAIFLLVGDSYAQRLEYIFSPDGAELTDPFPVGVHNGARSVSGPFDLDGDGRVEILLTQHAGAGGRVYMFENSGVDAWDFVYSTPMLDSTDYDRNARYATGGDLDGDGLGEIIFVAGVRYSDTDPTLNEGLYVFEYDGGGTNDYGDYPAAIGNFFEIDPDVGTNSDNVYAQKLQVLDIDGDGQQEVLIAANGPSSHDVFYVISLSGDISSGGAAGTFAAWNIESRINPRDDSNIYGGGSPSDMIAADLDGDGNYDISYHSWNNFNFFNGMVTGENTVLLPDAGTPNSHLQASSPDDHVAIFGGVAVDIDGDGNDEVFYPNFFSGDISVLDYSPGDNVLSIGEDNFTLGVIPGGGSVSVTAGDTDGDGRPEIIAGGSYDAKSYNAGEPSAYIRITEFNGGAPTDPASYATVQHIDTSHPVDTTGFNIVHRDSAGVTSRYFETARSKQGQIGSDEDDGFFSSGIAFLGDADGDGNVEIAVSFQSVDDSLQIIDEVFNPSSRLYDRTVRETIPAPARPFLRIYEFSADFAVSIDDGKAVPTGFALSANYPNPFNPTTTFSFTLPREDAVTVRIYDATGRVVRTLLDGARRSAGTHQLTWDGTADSGSSVSSGTYFYSLETPSHRTVRPMALVK